MQGLKVLPTIVDEIAGVNEIVDGCIHAQMDGKPDAYVTPCQQVRQIISTFHLKMCFIWSYVDIKLAKSSDDKI